MIYILQYMSLVMSKQDILQKELDNVNQVLINYTLKKIQLVQSINEERERVEMENLELFQKQFELDERLENERKQLEEEIYNHNEKIKKQYSDDDFDKYIDNVLKIIEGYNHHNHIGWVSYEKLKKYKIIGINIDFIGNNIIYAILIDIYGNCYGTVNYKWLSEGSIDILPNMNTDDYYSRELAPRKWLDNIISNKLLFEHCNYGNIYKNGRVCTKTNFKDRKVNDSRYEFFKSVDLPVNIYDNFLLRNKNKELLKNFNFRDDYPYDADRLIRYIKNSLFFGCEHTISIGETTDCRAYNGSTHCISTIHSFFILDIYGNSHTKTITELNYQGSSIGVPDKYIRVNNLMDNFMGDFMNYKPLEICEDKVLPEDILNNRLFQ